MTKFVSAYLEDRYNITLFIVQNMHYVLECVLSNAFYYWSCIERYISKDVIILVKVDIPNYGMKQSSQKGLGGADIMI